jgi:hypothetical protein
MMNTRAWATLIVRLGGLYITVHYGLTVLYWLALWARRGFSAGDVDWTRDLGTKPIDALMWPGMLAAAGIMVLIFSDGIIRWVSRVPGEQEGNDPSA